MTLAAHHAGALSERCQMCVPDRALRAAHKLVEVIDTDWPSFVIGNDPQAIDNVFISRHELSVYLCCGHFAMVMGPIAARLCQETVGAAWPVEEAAE